MKKRIKKTALFLVGFGLAILITSGFFAYKQYELITTGEKITGRVLRIIEIQGDDGSTYKPEISYAYKGKELIYTPNFSSSSISKRAGDPVKLFVSDKGVTPAGINAGWIALGIGAALGFLAFVIGLVWFFRHRRRYDERTRLKRYGRRIQGRFARKDTTDYQINDQPGNILYVEETGGEKRMFKTKPIFSEFSIAWLEEHVFDIYIDTKNPEKYYIDIEKHFGHPEPHDKKSSWLREKK